MSREITEPLVRWFRWQSYCGATAKMMSETYGFSENCIGRILRGERWKEVKNVPEDLLWYPKQYLSHKGYVPVLYNDWLKIVNEGEEK